MPYYVNLNMQRCAVPACTFSPQQGARGKWDTKDNVTSSINDAVFQSEREKSKKPVIPLKTQEEVAKLTDPVARIQISRQGIIDHFEEKVGAFLSQIIDAYGTDMHFTVGKTENQTKSTSSIKFEPTKDVQLPKNASTKMEFASAHHGTIPCIYSYDRTAWETWKAKGDKNAPNKPEAVVYFKGSDTYHQNNACTGLEKVINEVDIDLDGNSTEQTIEFGKKKEVKDQKLREFSIDLLNRAGKKEITPLEGFSLFLAKFETLIEANCSHHLPEHCAVSEIMKEQMQKLREDYQDNTESLVAHLLGLNIQNADKESLNLQAILFPRHFQILQQKNSFQSNLLARVDKLAKEILKQKPKKPLTFDQALKVALVKEASNQSENVKKVVKRHFNLNGETVKQARGLAKKPALDLVNTDTSKKLIREMMKDFDKYVRNFSIDQSKFHGGLLRELRKIHDISIRKFTSRHNSLAPNNETFSYGQLVRIEEGCVQTTPAMVKRFATVLGVPERVFTQFV